MDMIINCISDYNAEQQRDEIDAITAIYADDHIKLLRSALLDTSMHIYVYVDVSIYIYIYIYIYTYIYIYLFI